MKKVANRLLAHSAALRFASFAPRLFAYTGKLAGSEARGQSTRALRKQSREQCKHSQVSRSRNGGQNGKEAKQLTAPSALCPAGFREKQSL